APRCAATFHYNGTPGWHALGVRYFDQNNGVSHFRLWVNQQLIDEWAADDHLPTKRIDSSSSTRRVINGVALRTGDQIRIEGVPDGGESAAIDYVELFNSAEK
ncbi:MAG: alpha-glucuronidase family glycosyl hydrolase, partial [Gammaproteobacteria bacterium]